MTGETASIYAGPCRIVYGGCGAWGKRYSHPAITVFSSIFEPILLKVRDVWIHSQREHRARCHHR